MGDVFSFEWRQYFTSEAHDSVEVCVVHDSGDLEESVELTVCTTQGNALSNVENISEMSRLLVVVFPSTRFLQLH